MTTIHISPDSNAEWYVKAAIRRGMAAMQDGIDNLNAAVRDAERNDSPSLGTIRDMAENMIAYNEQMLREMKQFIPAELLEL